MNAGLQSCIGGPVERSGGSNHSPTNTLSSRGLPTSRSVHDSDPFSLSFGAAATETVENAAAAAAARPRPLSHPSLPSSAETIHSPALSSSAMESVDQLQFGASGSPGSSPGASEFTGFPVLIVDDDTITRMLMRRMLERHGCIVAEAENGQVAAQIVLGPEYEYVAGITGLVSFKLKEGEDAPPRDSSEAPRYGLIFLDNQMPIMSGLQTVRALRRFGRKEYVVGLTGKETFHCLTTDVDLTFYFKVMLCKWIKMNFWKPEWTCRFLFYWKSTNRTHFVILGSSPNLRRKLL